MENNRTLKEKMEGTKIVLDLSMNSHKAITLMMLAYGVCRWMGI